MTEYRAYLKRHYWRRVFPTLVGSSIVVGFCVSHLWRYRQTGEYVLHPWITLFLMLAGVSMIVVALVATWSISKYANPWSRQS